MPLAQLRRLQAADLPMVFDWRNDDAIRQWMVHQDIIAFDEHLAWYERNKDRTDRHFLIFEYDGIAEGYVSLVPVANSTAYEWGFYLRPNRSTKGLGMLLGKTALDFAFNHLNCAKIFAQVLGFNDKSIRFHQRLGFTQEGLLRSHFSDDRGTFDVYQFGMLTAEWLGKTNASTNPY